MISCYQARMNSIVHNCIYLYIYCKENDILDELELGALLLVFLLKLCLKLIWPQPVEKRQKIKTQQYIIYLLSFYAHG